MKILNIAGYKFTHLSGLNELRSELLRLLQAVRGTVLLSQEGININLAGAEEDIRAFQTQLDQLPFLKGIRFHQTFSEKIPYKFLKVKIKKEIITFRQPNVDVLKQRAKGISPTELKNWLENNKDFILLDTRNEFEVAKGTFSGAIDLKLNDFGEFPEKASQLPPDKPIVMFCTGGIRCEKAAVYLENQGFSNVYQLDGGILGYFAEVGRSHYQGDCFVFDEREVV